MITSSLSNYHTLSAFPWLCVAWVGFVWLEVFHKPNLPWTVIPGRCLSDDVWVVIRTCLIHTHTHTHLAFSCGSFPHLPLIWHYFLSISFDRVAMSVGFWFIHVTLLGWMGLLHMFVLVLFFRVSMLSLVESWGGTRPHIPGPHGTDKSSTSKGWSVPYKWWFVS